MQKLWEKAHVKYVMKRKLLAIIFSLIVLVASIFWKEIYVSSFLIMLPKNETEKLAHFFHFINIEGFPWVAKGIKPIATYYVLDDPIFLYMNPSLDLFAKDAELFWSLHPVNARFKGGMKVWKKYQRFFPSSKIVILSGPSSVVSSHETILIINLAKTKKIIEEHQTTFSKVLGIKNTKTLLQKLIKHPGNHYNFLKGNHHLLGLLYGFGDENAKAFQQLDEPYEFLIPPYRKLYSSHSDKHIELSLFLEDKAPYDPNDPWFYIPGFKVIPNTKETISLEEQYLQIFEKIKKEKSHTTELRWSLLQFF